MAAGNSPAAIISASPVTSCDSKRLWIWGIGYADEKKPPDCKCHPDCRVLPGNPRDEEPDPGADPQAEATATGCCGKRRKGTVINMLRTALGRGCLSGNRRSRFFRISNLLHPGSTPHLCSCTTFRPLQSISCTPFQAHVTLSSHTPFGQERCSALPEE